MSLRLYSTLSRTIEEFRPAGDEVRTYVCGVTPYDTAHLGHAFLYVSFDVLHRFLRYLGYRVRYIQNITDIDNDILRRAKELGEPWDELGNRYVKIHQDGLDALGVEPPVKYPRATEEIPLMVEMIESLIATGPRLRGRRQRLLPGRQRSELRLSEPPATRRRWRRS